MAISRMQQPRQMYGLGSLVKKAVRGVKKVVKSPLGKAAIGGALAFGIPGTGIGGLFGRAGFGGGATGLFGQKGIGATLSAAKAGLANRFAPAVTDRLAFNAARSSPGKVGFFSKLNPFGKNFDAKTAFLTGGAGLVAAPFLMDAFAPEEEVEEEVDVMDIAGIRKRAQDFYRGATDTGLNFMPQKQFVQPNFYAAAGGRAMLSMGGAPGGQQAEQMLMAEFVKYKNKGGTLSFEQFVKAVMQAQQEQQMAEGAGMEQPQPVAMAANGGRIGYANAGPVVDEETMAMIVDMNNKGMDISTISSITATPIETITQIISSMTEQANGGRVGFFQGGGADARDMIIPPKFLTMKGISEDPSLKVGGFGLEPHDTFYDKFGKFLSPLYYMEKLLEKRNRDNYKKNKKADGGRIGKQEGGIMDAEAAEMIDMGGMEKDYRETGGFVEMGGKERADDVPARLSKNEFVFTADAVRNAGGGDIDKGAEVMENLMDNLEQGGKVSEDSQGLEGAQAMYDQQQMLQSRVI